MLVDLLANLRIGQWQKDTFDPGRWDDHATRARDEKRNTVPPSPLPSVQPLAVRPAGWLSRTELLFGDRADAPPVDLEGPAADAARRAFFDDADDDI